MVATAAFAALGASAQQRVEITGSLLKRTDTETPVPVEVVTRKEIERTGATSVNELIQSISVVDINDAGELASNSPGGSGTARLRLRGLGDADTLVLVNGRRVPKNPLADATGAGSAFNVNSIPVAAIERIEILKDGGSAIYGADAVAGVVNLILRRDYTGAALKATYGQSSRSDGEEKAFSAVAGYGDLGARGFNLMAALDVLKREPILRKDRALTRSVDFTRFGPIAGYNLDGRSVFSPNGNYVTDTGALAGQTVTACPPEQQSGAFCVYDFNASILTAYNGADRISGLLNGTLMLGTDWSLSARWIGSEIKDHFEAHPVPDFFVSPEGAPFPFYAGRFLQGGPRITDKKTTFNHFDVSVEGVVRGFDVKVGASSGESKSTNRDRNYYDRTLWNEATESGAIDATSLDNDPALVESLKIRPVRTGVERLDLVDAQLAGDAFKLPGGTARYAVGLAAWNETIKDTPDPLQQAGQVVGSITQSAVSADRDAYAVFGELQLPITRDIEAQLAVRHDDYRSDSSTSPKVAAKWSVMPGLLLRASYSQSFKMPTLKQMFASAGQGAITLTPAQCEQVGNTAAECVNGLPAFRRTGSNEDLQAERGKTINLGMVADVGPASLGIDVFRVTKRDNITTPTLQSAIDQRLFFRDEQNRVVVLQNLQNFAQSRSSGVDLDARVSLRDLPVGTLSLRANTTYYTSQATRTTDADPWDEFNGTYVTPRWRATASATLERGPWTLQALIRGTGGFRDTDQPFSAFEPDTPGATRKVGAYDEVDVTVSWEGIRKLRLSAAVKNLFDRMPPFSAQNATNNNYTQLGFAELYNARGRYFQIGAEYSF